MIVVAIIGILLRWLCLRTRTYTYPCQKLEVILAASGLPHSITETIRSSSVSLPVLMLGVASRLFLLRSM
ncbi:hypothetical protein [Candidatus Aalborgicola defluviihabitans]|uniref:hypothetical protein n=1 Tax=Candidatus Aalborgicola defluviihabitans TaxID=3386187 RepID=UPI0039B99977